MTKEVKYKHIMKCDDLEPDMKNVLCIKQEIREAIEGLLERAKNEKGLKQKYTDRLIEKYQKALKVVKSIIKDIKYSLSDRIQCKQCQRCFDTDWYMCFTCEKSPLCETCYNKHVAYRREKDHSDNL